MIMIILSGVIIALIIIFVITITLGVCEFKENESKALKIQNELSTVIQNHSQTITKQTDQLKEQEFLIQSLRNIKDERTTALDKTLEELEDIQKEAKDLRNELDALKDLVIRESHVLLSISNNLSEAAEESL